MDSREDPTSNRPFRRIAGWLACTVLLGALGCSRTDGTNVILIVVDTLRSDHVGCYGADRPTTPAIDALAAEGVRFERAYSTAPWTKPSVASIFTGLFPSGHSAEPIENKLPESVHTLAEILSDAGYSTGGVISHFILTAFSGYGQGFDVYLESEAQGHEHLSTVGVTDQAVALLEHFESQGNPFFLFVHYFDPHYDYLHHPEIGFASERVGRLDGTQSILELRAMSDDLRDEELAQLRALYDEEIRFTDGGIGRLLSEVHRRRLDENTLIVFTADHGEEFREHGWIGHTRSLYQELLHVPLIIRTPGVPGAPRVVPEPVSLVSLAPTILELLGIDAGGLQFQGSSFAALVRGEAPTGGTEIFAEVDFTPVASDFRKKRAHKKAIIVDRFKLIRDDETHEVELYDLESDSDETRNLARERPELAHTLQRRLADLVRGAQLGTQTPDRMTLSPDEVERLRALGYGEP